MSSAPTRAAGRMLKTVSRKCLLLSSQAICEFWSLADERSRRHERSGSHSKPVCVLHDNSQHAHQDGQRHSTVDSDSQGDKDRAWDDRASSRRRAARVRPESGDAGEGVPTPPSPRMRTLRPSALWLSS